MTSFPEAEPRQLFARHARKDGRVVAVLRAIETGEGCVVESEVYPAGSSQATRPGPYRFADSAQATASELAVFGFVTSPSGPESRKITKLMETIFDTLADLRRALSSDRQESPDAPHYLFHRPLATT